MDDRHGDSRRTDTGWCEVPPTREAARELAQALKGCEGEFVSFQTCHMLALNPDYGNEVTPQGVYAFPKDWIIGLAEHHAKGRQRLRDTWFANLGFPQRPKAFTFSIGGRVLDTQSYREYEADQARLAAAIGAAHPEALPVIHAFTHNGKPMLGGEWDPRRMLFMTEHVVDEILGIRGREGSYRAHPEKPRLWRDLFLRMGIVALVDRNNWLTGDCPRQAAVFDDRAIVLHASFANPCAAEREPETFPAPRP